MKSWTAAKWAGQNRRTSKNENSFNYIVTEQNELKILAIDDEGKIAEVVESYLKTSGYKVYTAFNQT